MGLFDRMSFDQFDPQQLGGLFGMVNPAAFGMGLNLPAQVPQGFAPTDVSSVNRNGTSGVTLPQMDASGFGRQADDSNPFASLLSGLGNGLGSLFGGGPSAAPGGPQAPQQAPQGPDALDHLAAAWQGLAHGGLTSAITGLATGERADPQGLMIRALREKGASPAEAQAAASNPALLQSIAPKYFGENFKIVPFGSTAVDQHGKVLFENNTSGALLDDKTADFMAHQYLAGDTSVMQNLGRGAQGAQNIVLLRQAIARLNGEQGTSAQDQAMRNAEFFGVKAGQRTLGTKQANIEMAATEFGQVLPVVMQASAAVDRTNYPTLNKVIQAYEKGTGDPNVVKFASGVNTLVNLYARAISPSGAPTVSDKDHARAILDSAWSSGQFNAAVQMMQQEIGAALKSPGLVKQDMRDRFVQGTGGATAAQPAAGATTQAPVAPADALAQAKAAIAKGAPRDAVIQRLRASGIDPAGL